MINRIRNRHFFFLDVTLLWLAAYISFVLRLERLHLNEFWPAFILFGFTAVLATTFSFYRLGVYARYWRYASVDELVLLTVAVGVATVSASLFCLVVLYLLPPDWILPRSIPAIFFMLALGATAVPRFTVRSYVRYQYRLHGLPTGKNVLIAGAGDAGAMIAREMQRNPHLGMIPIGFVDDDPAKQGIRIQGVKVMGSREAIPELVSRLDIRQVIIAMPTAPGKTIRQFVDICEEARVQAKTMPGIYELLDGAVRVNQLRDVEIEDLLRREPVQTDITAVAALLHGKRVLVTGGGGSIGSELCRQICRAAPSQLILIGHGENSIFDIHNELHQRHNPAISIVPVIADTRSVERLRAVFQQYRPHIVFHAAAHKHVPLMEKNPAEAITNNVMGTRNLLQVVTEMGVGHFVMISTDKAVNPTSIMGASKRAAELLVHQAAERSGRPYVAVRFGNVLGSRGSVIHTFKNQIAAGGPLTITHPDMTRFFMTIPEAVQLVLQAAVLGTGSEVFVLDMGEPVKIMDLARDLVELSGLKPGQDIDIVVTGARPGEKLYEELFIEGESYSRTRHEKIYVAENASRFVPRDLDDMIHVLEIAAYQNDNTAITRALQSLIPEYTPLTNGTAVPPLTPLSPIHQKHPRPAPVIL
ncbi:MAG TPA: nucleoside-diphosphate sugar epimerase/dehydratase [Chloroflexota bacterium]|nr:nucleoside-diphosphate sugar epimerase/dehydratase [Chloroflexota bacterium]